MIVFRFGNIYKAFTVLLFALSCVALAMVWQGGSLAIAIFMSVGVITLICVVHAFRAKVCVDDGMIYTQTLFGARSLRLMDVNTISMIKLKGRYLFFLMTDDKYVAVNTVYADFVGLRDSLRSQIPATVFEPMERVSEAELAAATKRMNMIMAFVLVAYVVIVFQNQLKALV
jgi:hypothetical protein